MRVGLDGDHQILVGNPDIDRPIAETFALVEPLRAERPEYLVGQAEGEAARVIGGDRRDRLACFGRDKLGPFLLLLRWNHLPTKNRAHPAIDVAGAGDGAASRLHPGGADLAHVPPNDWTVPRFLALGLEVRARFVLEVAVCKALDDRLRVGAGFVER